MEDVFLFSTEATPLLGPCVSILSHLLKDFVAENSPLSPTLPLSLLVPISTQDSVVLPSQLSHTTVVLECRTHLTRKRSTALACPSLYPP